MKKRYHMPRLPQLPFWKTLLFLAILACGIYFRFVNLTDRVPLGDETVRDAVVGIVGAREWQMPISGPFLSIGSFTVGPWYWNHLIFGSLIFPTVFAPWITVALMSVCTLIVLFLLGRKIGGYWLGIVMMGIASISPPQIISAIHLTNPNTTIFYTALAVYIFSIIISSPVSLWWGFFLGVSLAMPTNMHFSGFNLYILILGVLLWSKNRIRQCLAVTAGIVVTFIPLLFFNLLNHWHTVRNVADYLIYGRTRFYVPNSWKLYIGDFWVSFWSDAIGLSKPMGIALAIASVVAIGIAVFYFRNKLLTKITVLFGILFIVLRYYWGERFFTYFTFFQPFIFLYAALPFYLGLRSNHRWVQILAGIFLLGYGYMVYPVTLKTLPIQMQTLELRRMVGDIKQAFPDTPIAFYNCKNEQIARDHAFMLLLEAGGVSSDNGIKIGFLDESCELPFEDTFWQTPYEETNLTLKKWNLVQLTSASQSAILEKHWTPLTFKAVYDIHTKWWYKEKP